MATDYVRVFCRQVRMRSQENRAALEMLHGRQLHSPVVAILRQELDSMVRVIYLLTIKNREHRDELIRASVDGGRWTHPGTNRRITDSEMVRVANNLRGWTQSVYRFGCAFIHLSNFHDHLVRDPFRMLTKAERVAILTHMRYYHGGPPGSDPSFQDLMFFMPMIFDKIASNLESDVALLESGRSVDVDEL